MTKQTYSNYFKEYFKKKPHIKNAAQKKYRAKLVAVYGGTQADAIRKHKETLRES